MSIRLPGDLDTYLDALWAEAQDGDCLECADLPGDELCPDHQENTE